MSLRIIYDFAGRTKVPEGGLVLRSVQDWVRNSSDLEAAARSQGAVLTVVVRHPSLASYLCGYKASYPQNVVEESADVVAQLAMREGEVPEGLDDEIVQRARLLDDRRPPDISFGDWVLNRLFGTDLFGRTALDPSSETYLLCVLSGNPALLQKPFVLEHLKQALATWERTGSAVAGWLRQHGATAANAALVGRLLAGYPDTVVQQALRDRDLTPEVPAGPLPDLAGLPVPLPSELPPIVADRLETLVHGVLRTLPLLRYLSCVSGTLAVELDVLVDRLMDAVDAIPIAEIRKAFHPLVEAGHADRINELEAMWAVKRPLVFPRTDGPIIESWHRVARFFQDCFVPAWRAVRSATDAGLRERLIQVDEQYADWLVGHFFELSLAADSPLADRVMLRRIQRCVREGIRVVWLVVDGAGWGTLTELLGSAVRARGGEVTDLEPSIAALPTITDVAMLSLVSLSPLEAIYPASEQSIWKRVATQSRKDREAAFHSQFQDGVYQIVRRGGDVIDALTQESSVYCLIYGEVDGLLHKNSDQGLFEKYQKSAIEDIIRWVYDALEATGAHARAPNGIRLVVTSDHGWTDIYRSEPVGIPHYLSREGLVEASHNRVLVLREDHLDDEIREALENDWHLLSGPRLRLPPQLTFLLPWRLARITAEAGRLHGGASMLETIVPAVEIAVTRAPWVPIVARLDAANLVAAGIGQARLTVKNPNDQDIARALVRIEALQAWQEVGPIPKGQTVAFDLDVRPTASGTYRVAGWIDYEVLSANRSDAFRATIVVQPSEQERMVGRHLADELFDELGGR